MASKKEKPSRYIIMPIEGFQHSVLLNAIFKPSSHAVMVAARATATIRPQMRVLDSIHENGPKLVEMPPEGELSLRLAMAGVKIVPEVFYHRAWYWPEVSERPARPSAAAPRVGVEITVKDRATGKPLRGAHVIAFTDFAGRQGAEGTTSARGVTSLNGIAPSRSLERFYVYGPVGYWGYYQVDTTARAQRSVALRPIEHADANLLLHQLFGNLPADTGKNVTAGIIDTGVDGTHPDLANVSGGKNCVTDEVLADPGAETNWGPAKVEGEHGTHVAGITAAKGAAGGFRGVAPGATLRSYRVFPDAGGGASNYDIAKAIDAAVTDGCQVINLSLGGGPSDDLTKASIVSALAAGVVVLAAAGNDDRSPVSFPAANPECIAVSAMGRRGSFPKDSTGEADAAKPFGDPLRDDFVAAFSNFGSQIDVTGPGVEIVSTLPGGGYGPMSGTSMATPATTGFAAHLLSANDAVRNAQGAERSRQLKDLLYSKCKPEGFGRDYEGFGLPTP
jgi:subtilisin